MSSLIFLATLGLPQKKKTMLEVLDREFEIFLTSVRSLFSIADTALGKPEINLQEAYRKEEARCEAKGRHLIQHIKECRRAGISNARIMLITKRFC